MLPDRILAGGPSGAAPFCLRLITAMLGRNVFLLLLLLLCTGPLLRAQSVTEAEPNNSFATATLLPRYPDTLRATIGGGDAIDYLKTDLSYYTGFNWTTGTLGFEITATNTGSSAAWLKAEVFNGLQQAGLLHSEDLNGTIAAGATITRTVRVCGLVADDFFLAMTTNGTFSYNVRYYFSDPNENTEPNNTRATAALLSFDTLQVRRQGIGYRFRQDPLTDTVDYFKTYLPAGTYSSISLNLTGKNNSCVAGKGLQYAVYRNNQSTPFATGYVGNNPAVPQFTEAFSAIPLTGMVAGDSLFLKLWSDAAFGYQLRFMGNSIDFEEEYDDGDYDGYSAEALGENQLKAGQVGYAVYENGEPKLDDYGDPVIDNYDTYQITLPQNGDITVHLKARNDGCGAGFYIDLLDEWGNTLSNLEYLEAASWNGDCNEEVQTMRTIRPFTAGTYRIRVHNGNYGTDERVSYTLRYSFDSYGDSDNDTESNNTANSAQAFAANETKKGNLRFIPTLYDGTDHYRTMLPTQSGIRVYIRAQYRGDGEAPYSANSNKLTFASTTSGLSRQIPAAHPSNAALTPGAVFEDTVTLATAPAGLLRFNFSANEGWQYSFRYEVTDTVAGPNDAEPNNTEEAAIPIAEKEIKKGRVGYGLAAPYDTEDYYKATLARGGAIKVLVKAVYRGAPTFNSTNTRLRVLVTGSTTTYSLPASSVSQIQTGGSYVDSFRICGVNPGDLYLRVQSSYGSGSNVTPVPYDYEISYQLEEPIDSTLDHEPDNTLAQAYRVASGVRVNGLLGLTYNGQPDMDDYHKLVVTGPDTLRITFGGTNASYIDNRYLRIYGYNGKGHLAFFKGWILNAVGTVDAGQTVIDSLKYFVSATDTIHIRMNGNGLFNYHFSTNLQVPSPVFSIGGDTTACVGPAYVYTADKIIDSNLTYHWSLPDGGGTLTANGRTATVVWNETANRRVALYLTNARGASITREIRVIVNGSLPTAVPVATHFARTLRTTAVPPGATCQWFKNGTPIPGATDSVYYAADAGSFAVGFVNDCGPGPLSNAFVFNEAAVSQTISFPKAGTVAMAQGLVLPLNATATSGSRVFYQKISGPGTLTNDSVAITGVGTVVIRAYQPGDEVYRPAPDVFDTITVSKGAQFITFDSIPAQIFSATPVVLGATSSVGLPVAYTVVTNNGSVRIGELTMQGVGTITVRASQGGSSNYLAAAPVERTFCAGVRTLTPIAGDAAPCPATYRYTTQKIPGAQFVWTLSGGGILTTHNDTAWVQWQTAGTHTLTVKANSACDTVYSEVQTFTATVSNNVPQPVSGMQPQNGARNQQLPLTLSWIPGASTVSYDLYLWDSTAAQPATPFAANLTTVSFTVPKNALAYNRSYQWRVVAKNPCSQTAGPVQSFRVIPLPDLVVSDVQAPATANAGETITVSWKVTNIGPGSTFTDARWYDGVYFSLDTTPDFRSTPNWTASSWNALTAQDKPLLLGKKQRPSALDSGEFYTNSISFTLPQQFSFPVYVYVITDNEHPNWKTPQASVANDTARKKDAMLIRLSPTPDLRVDSVFAPVTTFSGSTINLTYRVKNYGVVTPDGIGWTDSVFLSQSPFFDRNSAMALKLPKPDGSYYPDAVNAYAHNSTQLLPDAVLTKNLEVVIPNYLSGIWFIYVKTNADAKTKLYEGAGLENNVGQVPIQIILTPTPKLTVNSLLVPASTASTTQPFSINWNVHNDGFRDNIEKARGHYFTMGTCRVSCGPNAQPNSICVAPGIIKDSIVFGSSYWVDKVYLSADSSGLNPATARLLTEVKHGTQYSGIYPPIINCPANYFHKLNVDNVIHPNSDFPKTAAFDLPSDLAPGRYFIYVHTNAGKDVFEYPGTPQIKRSAEALTVSRPDVTVTAISAPANAVGGQTIAINYTVTNSGAGSVFNHVRKDRLYVSNFPSFDGSATLLSTRTVTENILAGTSVPQVFSYQLPPATSGARYFYVVTNFDSSFRETAYTNNRSVAAVTLVSAAVPSDLTVTSVQLPDTVFTIFNNTLTYTVANNGTGTTAGPWTDSLFVSCSPVFNPATSYFVARRTQTRGTVAGQSYTDTFSFAMPRMSYELAFCFPQTAAAPAFFFIKTNADTGTYEAASISNNVSAPLAKVLANPLVDHTIPHLAASADTATVGRTLGVQWTLKNIGYRPPYQYYSSYYDGIYLSADTVWSTNDVLAAGYLKYHLLNRADSMNENKQITVPNLPTGNYYLFAKTNYYDGIRGEKILTNNTTLLRNTDGSPRKLHIIQPLLPDLVDSILSAPASVVAGQPVTVVRRTTNRGAGPTYPASWYNDLRLSVDFGIANHDGDRLLWQKAMPVTLLPGQFRDDTVTVTIPLHTAPGNYVLIAQADAGNKMIESNEINNLGFSLLTVLEPPVVDLLVENVTHPDTVYLGYTLDTVKWVTRNNSPNRANGRLSEAVYLSQSPLFDSTAVLLGIQARTIDLDALQDSAGRTAPLVTGVKEGAYQLFVKTDLLDNFLEENENNNSTFSVQPVYVKVKELPLGVTEKNTLLQTSRYYKLLIPDSLIGSTIMVTLKSADSLKVRNELYIAGGYVPTPARHDYKFEIPNYGNQQIVITDVSQPVYYIEVRCATPGAAEQAIELKAVKLPFAVLNVQSSSGGNSGNVTVKISGSLFAEGMGAMLQNGGTTIPALQVYFTNSTQAYATFNLKGRPLGVYDVWLKKGDTATAMLEKGFSIVPTNNGGLITGSGPNTGSSGDGTEPGCDPGAPSGLNSQLVVELNVPPRVLLRRPVVLTINYRNPTNVDIPAQTRTLFSENVKMAFTREGVPDGSTALYLEFTEPGGPPGIIRAGGSGTIIIHTVAPSRMPAKAEEIFKLK